MFTKVSGHIWVKEREGHYGGDLEAATFRGPDGASLIDKGLNCSISKLTLSKLLKNEVQCPWAFAIV